MDAMGRRYVRLFRMCRRRGCSREDARDLVQEAHLRWFRYQQSTQVRDLDSLLRRIIINLTITHYRRVLSVRASFKDIDRLDRRGLLVDPTPEPDRALDAEQHLDALLAPLNPRTCQIFIAQRSGYSYEEIARLFAVKPRTVEKHVSIALSAAYGLPCDVAESFRESSPSGEAWAVTGAE